MWEVYMTPNYKNLNPSSKETANIQVWQIETNLFDMITIGLSSINCCYVEVTLKNNKQC